MSNGSKRGRSGSGTPPGRKPARLGTAEDTRIHILRHAVQLFNTHGYESVSLDKIASVAGVNRATVYYHFVSKEDLFIVAFERIMSFATAQTAFICAREDLSVRERIASLVRTRRAMIGMDHGDKLDEMDHAMVRAALSVISPDGHARIGRLFGELHGLTSQLIAKGIQSGELPNLSVEVMNFAFWSLFPAEGYPQHMQESREQIEEGLLRFYLGLTEPK